MKKKTNKGPRILFMDIETAPILAYVWGLWDQNVGLNMIKDDWFILSWSAKWQGKDEVMYMDQSKIKNISDDSKLLKGMWKLLDQADIVITQNGKSFDHKKLNARFLLNGIQPPSSFKVVDTYLIAKKHFALTSNKLEYMSDKLNTKYKKLSSKGREFVGFDLWKQCLARNPKAWKEMKKYNCYDVLALEELFNKVIPWENNLNLNLYVDDLTDGCNACGHPKLQKNGYFYSATGRYQRYKCGKCGAEHRDRKSDFSADKSKSIKVRTTGK